MENINITEASKQLFIINFEDAINWDGEPLLDDLTKEQRGNLTQLKVQGLLTTETDGEVNWIHFTSKGIAYGESLGLKWYN